MTMKIYSVKDEQTHFQNPFVMVSEGEAIRAFTQIALDPASTICKSKADYALYEIGVWNMEDGTISANKLPKMIMRANSVKEN